MSAPTQVERGKIILDAIERAARTICAKTGRRDAHETRLTVAQCADIEAAFTHLAQIVPKPTKPPQTGITIQTSAFPVNVVCSHVSPMKEVIVLHPADPFADMR